MRDRSSCLVHWLQRDHLAREDLMSCSLSAGSHASRADESSRMPRYFSSVVGPLRLSYSKGMLSCSLSCEGTEVSRTLVVFGVLAIKKSAS